MIKSRKLTIIVMVFLILTGCSSVKLGETYQSDDFSSYQGKNVLVIARSPNDSIRKEYEKEIALNLRKKGLPAIESHLVFDSLQEINASDDAEVAQTISMFREEGYDILLLTALKDVKEQVKVLRDEGYSSLEDYYGNRYVTLKGYYDDVHAPPKLPPLENKQTTQYLTSTTYIIEAVMYNLALSENNRLLSVTTVEATDPETGLEVKKGAAKIIAKQLR